MDTIPRRRKCLVSALFLLPLSVASASAETTICAAEQAISCTPFEVCERGLPGAVSLPVLMKIDSEAAEIVSVQTSGEVRSSAIASFEETETAQLIHGADEARPWVVHINRETGRFTGTVSGDSVAFVVFGECSWGLLEQ